MCGMSDATAVVRGNPDETLDFLKKWEPRGLWVLTAIDAGTGAITTHSFRSEQEREALAWLTYWNGKRNLYFSVNRLDRSPRKKAEKKDIVAAVALHVDIDPEKGCGDLAGEQERILNALLAYRPEPSVVIFSGGGYQGFWLLKEAVPINGKPEEWERVEQLNRGLEETLGGDHCFNIDRIMRLPGTVNIPNKKKLEGGRRKAQAALVKADWTLRYDLTEFVPARITAKAELVKAGDAEVPWAELPEWTRRLIDHGRDPTGERGFGGDRSRAVWAVACAMVRAGRSDEEIVKVLTDSSSGISGHVLDQGSPAVYAKRQAEQARAKVGEGFVRSSSGQITATPGNIRLALLRLGVDVAYDVFSRRYLITGPGEEGRRHLGDEEVMAIFFSIYERWGFKLNKDMFWDFVLNEARRESFHPVREYLGELVWDGVGRIDNWLVKYCGAFDSEYTRAIGALLLLAAVRRVRQPGCKFDEMVILISPQQGLDKSSALRALAVRDEWFSDSLPLDATEKEVIEVLSGHWIVEAGELKGMRGAAMEHLKAFLSRQVDRARMSYGRAITEVPRQSVIVATTNTTEFLRDASGNRRFWPVEVQKIKLEELIRDRDQIWAEAAAREAMGVSIRLDPGLWAAAAEEQEKRMVTDPWLVMIHNELGDFDRGRILCADMWTLLEVPKGMRTQEHNARLGEVMRAMGWERVKLTIDKGSQSWCYAKGDAVERQTRICIERDAGGVVDVFGWKLGERNPREYGEGGGAPKDNMEKVKGSTNQDDSGGLF